MTKNRHVSRKTNRIVRAPATKFPQLQKRLKTNRAATIRANKKGKRF
jgi:hypothetical protein